MVRTMIPTEEIARQLDQQDELAAFRDEFYRPEQIYLDGNSLGLLSRPAESSLLAAMEQWKQLAIGGWLEAQPPWFEMAEQLGGRIAELLGADRDEVVVANSTTVNLHQCLATFYDAASPKSRILIDELAFPTDRYAIESFLRRVGKIPERDLVIAPSADGLTLDEHALIERFTDGVQIAILPTVIYTSGQLLDVPRIAQAARRDQVILGLDCSHSVGSVPHGFSAAEVDFAVGCSYKYLNGGPGAPAFVYLNRRHFQRTPGLAGWFGHRKETMFEMRSKLEPAPSAGRLQQGTPSVLAMAPLHGSLDLLLTAGRDRLRAKSLRLTDFLIVHAKAVLSSHGVRVCELPPGRRGGHVALLHPQARSISSALRARGVVPDFRPPHILRLCPAPLYTTFTDCYKALQHCEQVLATGEYERFAADERIP